jgi:hypothetical protein
VAVTDVIAPAERSATQTTFVLSGVLTTTAATFGSRGTISYAGNVWSFTTAGATTTAFQLVGTGTLSDPNVVFPRRLDLVTSGGAADFVRVTWSTTPVTSVTPSIGPPVLDIDYNILLTSASGYARGDRNLDPSAGATPRFQLPVTPTNPGGIVPGTLAGTINVDGFANAFRTDALFSVGNNPRTVPLFFGNQNAGAAGTTGSFIINGGTGSQRTVTATGYVDYDLGRIFLEFTGGQDPGPVSVTSASYATFNQDAASSTFTLAPGQDFSRQLYVDLLTPGSRVDIASPVLQTVTSGNLFLNATNVNFNAQTRVNNRFDVSNTDTTLLDVVADRNAFTTTALARAVVDTAGGISALGIVPFLGGQGYDAASPPIVTIAPPPATSAGGVQATATAVVRNGSVVDFIITNPGSGYTTTPTVTIAPPANQTPLPSPSVERLNFNASVAAPIFDLTIADDVNTDSVARGTLFVSPTGSLSGALSATAGAVTTAATSLFVQADKSDLLVEGTIFATAQSYLLRSDAIDQALSPFVLTTVSPRTGADTGLIRGTSVAVTLGNDADTPEAGAVAANSLSLRTQIDSMRVTAATRKGAAINGPFPYNMSIREVDSISFDAVAASSDVISLAAAGNVGLTSALATAGNVVISAGGDFTVSAPISTSRGAIGISATNVTVSNSLRVLDPRVDDAVDDVTLTATGGSISLTGAITGVNNIRLVQRNPATGAAGRISGSARLTAKGLNVEAEGSATLRSDVSTFEGRTGGDFSLDELNDIDITSLRSPGLVSLTAGGVDPAAGAALRASLIDVTTLQVSAPKGSVDVFNNTSKTLTLGNPATIAAGTATSMKAAGSVVIRSSAGPIVIADAPVGGGGATVVRVATNGVPLDATFAYNTPGQYPSTLTSVVNRLLAIDGVVLRVGDRVLVKDQPLARSYENGVYVVTVAGSAGRPWVLSRATDADTTAEVPEKTPVQVAEGSLASQVYSATYTTTDNVSPISVTTITARADAARVRVASTIALPGTYDAINGTITGFVGLPLPSDGVALGVGDRMLVRLGAAVGGASANGIYEVTDIGGAGSQWILKRALDIDTGLPFTIGAVATTEGSFRASLTGQAFLLSYDSLGVDPLTWDPVTDIEGNPAVRPTTNIGTDDVASSATFVVSSTAGTNDSAGSLGKLLLLRQANDTSSEALNPEQTTAFTFASVLPGLNGAAAGVIRLTQELPAITKTFAIDGSTANRTGLAGVSGSATPRVVVDGSRIITTRSGSAATAVSQISGFEFATGSGADGAIAGASIANITAAGFAKGAAVRVNGVNGILVNGMTLGVNETGSRLPNAYGVQITGANAGATILGGTIVGNTQAGVRIDANARDYTIVGTKVGAANQNNVIGVDVAANVTRGNGRLGVSQLSSLLPRNATVKADTEFGERQLSLTVAGGGSTAALLSGLYIGQQVRGGGIPNGAVITAIDTSTPTPTITISKDMTTTSQTVLTFGTPARTTIEQNLTGVQFTAGNNTVTNTDVRNNTYSGIEILGGTQYVGTSTTRDSMSNAIHSNGRWGVHIVNAADAARQKIWGNYLGMVSPNRLGNVGVNGKDAAKTAALKSLGYVPDTKSRVDASGNQHGTATGSAASRSSSYSWRAT